jgi:8-oxo-dGTP diphosphatase
MDTHNHRHHYHHPAPYRFCPRCGGVLTRRVVKVNEPERLVCNGCEFIFYLDPKVVAGTICTIQDEIVLLRRGIEPAMGRWVFPGGYVDRGENVADAAIRETLEESALEVAIRRLLGVYSYTGSPNVIVVYVAEVVSGDLRAGDESVEAMTYPVTKIPWEELAFPSTAEALKDFIRLYYPDKIC